MKVKFTRLWGIHRSGEQVDITEEEYRLAQNHCIPMPEETARAEPVIVISDHTTETKKNKANRR